MQVATALEIRALRPDDWPEVARIYEEGIRTGHATFETAVPSWVEWHAAHLREHRLVAVLDGRLAGWTALSPVSSRCVYAGIAEHSVYVAAGARRRGVGRELLAALIDSSERAGIWTLESGIFPENAASLALHAALGFRVVGVRRRLGRLHGVWRDVLLLERRSEVVV
jgi:L-amino acid N-acyltransferase YncA